MLVSIFFLLSFLSAPHILPSRAMVISSIDLLILINPPRPVRKTKPRRRTYQEFRHISRPFPQFLGQDCKGAVGNENSGTQYRRLGPGAQLSELRIVFESVSTRCNEKAAESSISSFDCIMPKNGRGSEETDGHGRVVCSNFELWSRSPPDHEGSSQLPHRKQPVLRRSQV